ncbi:MAG: hypothetical protein A2033_15190 [Bacteroidetes bacterium GWA2_31_9]|nr:MAG: hypothetical protein A2033_15190 [Bacteroidetes bacterium GWA2_31_9]
MNFKFYLAITSLFIVLSYNAFSQFNADFSTYTPINGCSPLNVVFKDQSTGTITSRKWIFGNGNQTSSGNQTMPSAIYGIPGAYTVTLIVSDGTNYDTIIKPAFITVYNDPVADFTNSTALSGCNPLNIGLLDNSTSLDGAITIWNWDFGDGQTSTDHLPTHTYVDYGTFPVTLTVFDEHGCNDTKIIENYVNISQTPVPDFVASDTSQCFTPFNVSFTNLSTSAGNLTFSWNFGEGTTSTLTSPSNTFNSFGSYDITLFASDENGCSDTIIKNDYITILDATADFNTSKSIYCIDEDVTFDNTSVGCTSYLWNFGDGVTDTAKNPVHSYATWGDYNVKLISFIENSVCSDTIIKTITVERIEAAFTLDPARYCELPVTVNFTDQSINAVSWEWDLGYTITNNIPALERIITNAQNPSIIYKHTGFDTIPFYFYRDITLTATSAHGCSGTITVDSSLIVTIPNINIYPKKSGGCIPKDFFISDSSTYNSSFDFVTSRIWTLHDGSSNTSQNFTINYTNEGNYNECYKLTTSLGCIYYDTVKIEVGTPQNPNFSVNTDTSCASIGVEFINNSYNEYLIDTVSWVFRSNNDSIVVDNLWSPIVFFNDSGYFTGNLTINYNGCDTTISKDSVVYIKGPYAEFYKTFNCINQNEYSFHTNIIDADNWMWDFKDGFFDSTTVSPNHTFTSSGDYLVSINLSNIDNQCTFETNDDSVHWVRARNLKADYITNFVHGCPGISINFDPALSIDEEDFGYPNPNYNYHKYLWYYDDGSTFYSTQEYQFTDTFVTHTFTEKGIYHTSLIVEDINGCRDTTYKTITIYLPQPDFSTAFESGCKPFNVSYNNTTPYDTTITAWHWNFGNGDTSNI